MSVCAYPIVLKSLKLNKIAEYTKKNGSLAGKGYIYMPKLPKLQKYVRFQNKYFDAYRV